MGTKEEVEQLVNERLADLTLEHGPNVGVCKLSSSQADHIQAATGASSDMYIAYLSRLLLENPSYYTNESLVESRTTRLITLELSYNLRKPKRLNQLAMAIAGDEHIASKFDLTQFVSKCHLDDPQAAMLAVCLLCRQHESPSDPTKVLTDRFSSLLRHISIKTSMDDLSVPEVDFLARQLLLNDACSKFLGYVQKLAVEYAIFQRFQVELPPEIRSFFDEYNQSRAQDDHSKSLAQLFDETRGAATNTLTSIDMLFERRMISSATLDLDLQISDLFVTMIHKAYAAIPWNGEKLGMAIGRRLPDADWSDIIRSLDREDLRVANSDDLALLLSILRGVLKSGTMDVPVHLLWGNWRNTRAQATLLRQLTSANQSVFNILDYRGTKVLSADDFVSAPAALKNLAAQLESSPWNSLDLLATSLRLLSDDEAAAQETKSFLEAAGKLTPELIFLGCVQLPQPWGAQQQQLSEKGFEVFFGCQPNHQLVFYRLWQVNAEFLCQKLIEYHAKDSLNIDRILEIADDLHILDQLLNLHPLSFAIDLAALAAQRDFLQIEKWLDHHISTSQDTFIEACLRFLSFKAEAENALQQSETTATPITRALRVETVAIFLKALMNTAMSPENGEILKQVQSACLQVYPRLMNSTNANRELSETNNFAKDVEKEVEYYYGKLYEGDMSITSFVEMLQTLKRSTETRDQDVFACMLHSLFDEYRFFADYPLSALGITAVLFGCLIQNQLLSYIPLGIALRYILDAVTHDVNSNMFKFGVQALTHFKDRVPAWPQYCQQILAIPSLARHEPELVALIRENDQRYHKKDRLRENEEPRIPMLLSHESVSTINTSFRSLRSTPRDLIRYSEPSVDVSDKILFNINNMTLTNLSEKLEEVQSVLEEQYYGWFAIHLVSQRAAVEPNYHSLYIHFLEAMQDDNLIHRIVQETIENITLLLNSENTIRSTVERTNLKNLGSWLGGLTLARNKPLKHKMISLKDLLLEGFDSNRLLVVLPFVCRVLEQTINSKVFRPPCPWTMGIIGLLIELYETAEMKLNLKFEVEVLCKKLDLQMSDIPATSSLRDRPYIPEEFAQPVEDLQENDIHGNGTRRNGPDGLVDLSTSFINEAISDMPIAIHSLIQQSFAVPNLRRLVTAAAERAVREFIIPVVERSVAVASISTSQLVSKDFAFEEDLVKFRRAAHIMNQNLAGRLALVTCKEPLRVAFTTNLRLLLAQCGFEGLHSEGETLLNQLISDNLDSACMIIERAATERAVAEIDEGLAGGYQARRVHLDSRPDQNFSDANAPRYAFPLPASLRLRASGLTSEQMNTYEDFARVPRTAHEATVYYAKEELRSPPSEQESPLYRSEQQSANAFEQILNSLADVDALARESIATSMEDLGHDSSLRIALQQIPVHFAGLAGTIRDERTLTASQRVCQLLFKIPYNELAAQCLTFLLNTFVEMSLKTFRDVSIWLVHSEDTRKLNVPVIQALIRAQIIVPSEFDVQLAKQISMHKPAAIEFAIGLIMESVLGPSPVALRTDFTSTLDALNSLLAIENVPGVHELFGQLELARHQSQAASLQDNSADYSFLREQISLIFMEWVHLISHPATTEKTQLAYLLQLQNSGILTDDNLASLFFRGIVEQSIESAMRMMPVLQSDSTAHYLVIDAAAKLIILVLKFVPPQEEESAQCNFRRILNIIAMVFVHEHKLSGYSFNQRPFFRIFASIMSELHAQSTSLSTQLPNLLRIICDALLLLQPQHYPGFTFSWMTLISHRLFMPKILASDENKNWPKYAELMVAILSFLAPSLERSELPDKARVLYHAVLRMVLVLLNDFPRFLDEMSYTFMNIIP